MEKISFIQYTDESSSFMDVAMKVNDLIAKNEGKVNSISIHDSIGKYRYTVVILTDRE